MTEPTPECREPGLLVPVIDRNRCEGKADCVEVCPYDVFAIAVLPVEQRAALSWTGRAKSFFHGWKQAFAVQADRCHACGACVSACPERAITLRRPSDDAAGPSGPGKDGA
jgi:4Fe-4S ferredoxin